MSTSVILSSRTAPVQRRSSGSVAACLARVFALLLLLPFASSASARAPDWAERVARRKTGAPEGASASLLFKERRLRIDDRGIVQVQTREVIRILTEDGRRYAIAQVPYNRSYSRVLSLKAWLISPSGKARSLGSGHRGERPLYDDGQDLYGEARLQFMDGRDQSQVGTVFASESIVEEQPFIGQYVWTFADSLHTDESLVTISAPKGWEVATRLFNPGRSTMEASDSERTWRLRDVPAARREPDSPSLASLRPWMGIDFRPPEPLPDSSRFRTFASWTEVADYFHSRYEEMAQPHESITAKAAELVRGADTAADRARALARFAQRMNYIVVSLDAESGGTLVPRPARDVLRYNYGDCKDKVNILRALLAAQGVPSYPVATYAGQPQHVQEQWPSPWQFNHCIIAIAVDQTTPDGPAVVTHPTLGRLLLFDPASADTPFGLLRLELLGGKGLVLAPGQSGLLTLPAPPAGLNRSHRAFTARLDAGGTIEGSLAEDHEGYASVEPRRQHRVHADYKQLVRGQLKALGTTQVTAVEVEDGFPDAKFRRTITFLAAQFAQARDGTGLEFKPLIAAQAHAVPYQEKERTLPLVIASAEMTDVLTITVPEEFELEEPFETVEINSDLGAYRAALEFAEGRLVVKRTLSLKATTVPPPDYPAARAFFEKIRDAEQAGVLLRKR